MQIFLYGKMNEKFVGAHAGFSAPPNNTLSIQVLALTSVGTIYCHSSIKLTETEEIEQAKEIYHKLSVIETDWDYNSQTGQITIK